VTTTTDLARHYFTQDETYALTEQFKCGDAAADRSAARADQHRRAADRNRGTITDLEMRTAYALGHSGCSSVPALYGSEVDALLLPSAQVHSGLGYLVCSTWRARAELIVKRGHEGSELAAQWLELVRRADEHMAKLPA
jgi:hypothetical protein